MAKYTKERLFEVMSALDPNFKTKTVNISQALLNRVPFLKEYNVFENNPNRLEAQKIGQNTNYKRYFGDNLVTFENYNAVSEFYFYTQHINDNMFYNFVLKNEFYISKPKEIDDLTFTVFIHAVKMMEEKLSYHKDVMVKDTETLSDEVLNKIINEINGKLFEFEEYTNEHKLNLFENEII